jgi:hypothetical protein
MRNAFTRDGMDRAKRFEADGSSAVRERLAPRARILRKSREIAFLLQPQTHIAARKFNLFGVR